MANKEHSVLTGSDLHEVKGMAAASNGDVLSKASGVGAWVLPNTLAGLVKSPLFIQTADKEVVNTVTETSLLGTGTGSLTIPANSLILGDNLSLRLQGIISNTATPTLRVRVKIGGTLILDSTAVALVALSDDHFIIELDILIRTIGASGTAIAAGGVLTSGPDDLPLVRSGVSPDTIAVDTTGTLLVEVTVEWGTASTSNTILSQIGVLRKI